MFVLECVSCGAQYAPNLRDQWGKTKETSGYGSLVRCVALVPFDSARKDDALQCCGGMFAVVDRKAPKFMKLTPLT